MPTNRKSDRTGPQTSNNPKCIRLLQRYGYRYATVERFNHFAKIRQDFPYSPGGGFADILAWRPLDLRAELMRGEFDTRGILAVQICSDNTLPDHISKLIHGKPSAAVRDWLLSGNRLEIWAFPRASKVKQVVRVAGSKRGQLDVRIHRCVLTDDGDLLCQADQTELTAFGYTYRPHLQG